MSTSFEIVNSHIYNNIFVKFHNRKHFTEKVCWTTLQFKL